MPPMSSDVLLSNYTTEGDKHGIATSYTFPWLLKGWQYLLYLPGCDFHTLVFRFVDEEVIEMVGMASR